MTDMATSGVRPVYSEATMRRLPVDVEHLGIRVVVPLLAVGGFLLSLWVGPVVLTLINLQDTAAANLVLPIAILAAIGAAFAGDRLLKGRWSSGREILLDDQYLVLREGKAPEHVIALGERVNLLAWRFVVPRRGRIPKGFLCLAVQLIQNDEQVTVYTFCDPKRLDEVVDNEAFMPLASRKTLSDGKLNMRVAGQQRRLLQAEDARWRGGAELGLEEFQAVWISVRAHQVNQVA